MFKSLYFIFYVILYFLMFLMSSCSGLGYEDHTNSYPEPGECMIVPENVYYFNAIAYSKYPCLLGYEGLGGVIWITFIISFFFFWLFRILRKEIWQERRLGAMPEWILITLCYWIFLMKKTPQIYTSFSQRFDTLKAVFEIYEPFIIWQFFVTVIFWIHKRNSTKHPRQNKQTQIVYVSAKKILAIFGYIALWGIITLYCYFFLNSEAFLSPNTGEDTCRYTNNILFNNFWEKRPCFLTFEGTINFYLPLIFYFYIVFVFLLMIKKNILPNKNRSSILEWLTVILLYIFFLLFKTVEMDLFSITKFIGGIIGSLILFSPLLLYQFLLFLWNRK